MPKGQPGTLTHAADAAGEGWRGDSGRWKDGAMSIPGSDPRPASSAASLRWRLLYAAWAVRDHLRGWWRNAKEATLDD